MARILYPRTASDVMRHFLIIALLLASCSAPGPGPETPASEPPSPTNEEKPVQSTPAAIAPITPPPSSGPLKAPEMVRTSLSGIAIEAVSFDSRTHQLVVADQIDGPGSLWPDCRAAGKALQGIAAINAGFFTPQGEPLGRVVTENQSRGSINRASSLGSGFYLQTSSGSMRLVRRESFSSAKEAVQSGPFLIESDQAVAGLSNKQSSARTIVAWDGASRWLIARTGACSLASLAEALRGRSIGSTRLITVLNLDGGRSSEIWASSAIQNGPHFERPFWNKPVRNYLVLRPR